MPSTSPTNKDSALLHVKDTLGRDLRDLRISVIDKCNLRCTYCMPAEEYHEHYEFLKERELLSFDEILRVAKLTTHLGVTKLRLTGGEPLLRKKVSRLVAMLAEIEGIDDLALTTNGMFLAQQAKGLKDAGLRRVTVSLDTLDDDVFGRMNGRGVGVASVLDGIQQAIAVGLSPVKINVVVQRGVNEESILDIVEFCRDTGCVPRFIEYMDVGNRNHWNMEQVVPSVDIAMRIHKKYPLRLIEKNHRSEVAARYAFLDGKGEIGFISSITEPFCGSCSRVRLSADGSLFTCLFAGGGMDIRSPMRAGATDSELVNLLAKMWRSRTDRYSEVRRELLERHVETHKVEMYQIGG